MVNLFTLFLFLNAGLVKSESVCTCAIEDVDILEEPNYSSSVIGTLISGDCVSYIQKVHSWNQIILANKVGYLTPESVITRKCDESVNKGNKRFLSQSDTDVCMSEHCLNCVCNSIVHEGHCGSCHPYCKHNENICNDWNNRVDGAWSDWQAWRTCSVSCGGGSQTRIRLCNNPPKLTQFGKNCPGESLQTQPCNTHHCPIDGGWSAWTSFSACTVSCGGGQMTRSRACTNPTPNYGGALCPGDQTQTVSCKTNGCPVDGGWSAYGAYSTCTKTCGGGTRTRDRTCTNPTPINGGAVCQGQHTETTACNQQYCPVDGNWNNWENWISCDVTCGGGTQIRFRLCENPKPMYNGNDCIGQKTESRSCSTNACPINGGWSAWGPYSACSVHCGSLADGFRYRSRQCDNPIPQYNGSSCSGHPVEYVHCRPTCPSTTAKTTSKIISTTQASTTPAAPVTQASTTPAAPVTQSTTVKPTTAQPSSQVTVSSRNCDKLGIVHALGSSLQVSHSFASRCSDGTLTSPEAIIMEYCLMGRVSTWQRGMSVLDACNKNLLTYQFVPIASYENSKISAYSGIFMGCAPGGFKVAMQLCDHPVKIYHIFNTSSSGSGILDPYSYYIVNV